MEYLVFWLICAFVAAAVGEKYGATWSGFFLGLFLGPLGIVVAFTLKGSQKKCPRCAELVKKEAAVCRFCQCEFPKPSQTVPIRPVAKSAIDPSRDPSVILPGDIPNPRIKTCPGCGEDLMREAVRCRHCGHEFEPRLIAARRR